MLNKTGVSTKDLVLSKFFDEKTLFNPKAIIECYEEIPCNPCATSCPFDAIHIGQNINTIPKLDVDLCTGRGICVTSCPGLAIMVAQVKDDKAIFKVAYEFNPKPLKGDVVKGVNRYGVEICDCEVLSVRLNKNQDHTALIEVSAPIELIHDFASIKVKS